jgi:hypothetical protein
MLSAEDFESMPMEQQEECLSHRGNFLISRNHDDKRHVDLYSLNNFFVEVWYVSFKDALDKNFQNTNLCLITHIVTIKNEECINQYIDLYKKINQ